MLARAAGRMLCRVAGFEVLVLVQHRLLVQWGSTLLLRGWSCTVKARILPWPGCPEECDQWYRLCCGSTHMRPPLEQAPICECHVTAQEDQSLLQQLEATAEEALGGRNWMARLDADFLDNLGALLLPHRLPRWGCCAFQTRLRNKLACRHACCCAPLRCCA